MTYSRHMFRVAYPRETQEMVFDAHDRAFAFFGGGPLRMVYDAPQHVPLGDNLKADVEAILTGKERRFNRRFMAQAHHYVFEAVACTPESGWEKGQVENQVGNVREGLFTPLARFPDLAALNVWLDLRCRELVTAFRSRRAATALSSSCSWRSARWVWSR